MPIKYIKGDLFGSEDDIILHGVNCRGSFGSGVAGQIAKLYSPVRDAYLLKYRTEGWSLGDIQMVALAGKIIINGATQDTYGKVGVYTNLEACRMVFDKVLSYAHNRKMSISMPKIGSGLGGRRWNEIEGVLLKSLGDYKDVMVSIYYL